MFKKGILAVLLTVMLAAFSGVSVFAETVPGEVQEALKEIGNTNSKIEKEIEKAVVKADELHAAYLYDLASVKDSGEQEKVTEKFNDQLNKLYVNLDEKTKKMTEKTVRKAVDSGVDVEVYWVPVELADRTVLIDPIRVIGW